MKNTRKTFEINEDFGFMTMEMELSKYVLEHPVLQVPMFIDMKKEDLNIVKEEVMQEHPLQNTIIFLNQYSKLII